MPTNISNVTASPAAAGGYAGAVVEIAEWMLYHAGIADIPSEVTIAFMVVLAPILHVAAKVICRRLDCNDLNAVIQSTGATAPQQAPTVATPGAH